MKKLALLSLALIAFFNICNSQPIPTDSLYFGQTPPGSTPKVFAPGIVSVLNRKVHTISFSPSGTEVFFAIGGWPNRVVLHSEYKNNKWTVPDTASFSMTQSVDEPSFSPNGNRVYYYAYKPNSSANANIYYSEKSGSDWSIPVNLGSPVNSTNDEWHPCVVNDSSLYFINGSGQVYNSIFLNGKYQNPLILPAQINNNQGYADPYVSPDESYMILNSSRNGGYGGIDLYIAYRKPDLSWTNPKNLGNKINTSANESSADITSDGKYMTFDYNMGIYWVSASFIDSLKHTNFIPYLKNQIKNQTDTVGHSFRFTISDTTFFDDDGNNTLTFAAALSNGNPLPKWLPFDPDIKTFSGTLDSIGIFSIKVTATDTAEASVSTTFTLKVVSNPTNLKQQTFKENIQIFPNPTNDKVTVSFGSLQFKSAVAEITDISGKLISMYTYYESSTITIDLTGNPKGIYILNLTIDGYKLSKKILFE